MAPKHEQQKKAIIPNKILNVKARQLDILPDLKGNSLLSVG